MLNKHITESGTNVHDLLQVPVYSGVFEDGCYVPSNVCVYSYTNNSMYLVLLKFASLDYFVGGSTFNWKPL